MGPHGDLDCQTRQLQSSRNLLIIVQVFLPQNGFFLVYLIKLGFSVSVSPISEASICSVDSCDTILRGVVDLGVCLDFHCFLGTG